MRGGAETHTVITRALTSLERVGGAARMRRLLSLLRRRRRSGASFGSHGPARVQLWLWPRSGADYSSCDRYSSAGSGRRRAAHHRTSRAAIAGCGVQALSADGRLDAGLISWDCRAGRLDRGRLDGRTRLVRRRIRACLGRSTLPAWTAGHLGRLRRGPRPFRLEQDRPDAIGADPIGTGQSGQRRSAQTRSAQTSIGHSPDRHRLDRGNGQPRSVQPWSVQPQSVQSRTAQSRQSQPWLSQLDQPGRTAQIDDLGLRGQLGQG